jgi:hypothetical protein
VNKTRKTGQHQVIIGTIDFSLKSKDIQNTEVTVLPPSFDYWNGNLVHGSLSLNKEMQNEN